MKSVTTMSKCYKIKPANSKENQPWILIGRTDAEAPIFWPHDTNLADSLEKNPDAKKDWRQKDDRWDGWMASSIQWTCTWVNSKRWWGTGKPGVPQCIGSQRVRHDLVTEQQQQHTPQLLSTFTCWWVLRLLTHPGNCK